MMGRISEETIETIIHSNNIVDVISEFVQLKKTGRNYMGICPFHGDKGPSLSVSEEKQLYHCFGCGASGNVVGFIMKIRNIEYVDALKYLADRSGINIDFNESNTSNILNEKRQKIFEANLEAARFFYVNMLRSKSAIDYINKRKLDRNTVKKFGIGYSRNDFEALHKHLKSKGFSDEVILNSGLVLKNDKGYVYDRFRNRIMFPVFDIKNRVIGFGGRVLDDSKPKYLNSPETPVFKKGTNLYGLNAVLKSKIPDSLIIVEGYMDCIALHQHGIENAVASLGTSLTINQAKLVRRYCRDVFICYDADTAGQTATLRGLDILSNAGCIVKIIMIPNGKDPDEFLKISDSSEFNMLIKNALPVIDYRIQKAKTGKNLKETSQKSMFLNEAAEIISSIQNPIEQQLYAGKIFDETGIDVKSIIEQVNRIKENKNNKENNKENTRDNNISGNIYTFAPAYKKAEKMLLSLCISKKENFDYISSKIKPEEFITDSLITAAKIIYEKLSEGDTVKSDDIINKFHKENDINDVSQIFYEDNLNYDAFSIVDDYIKTIKKYNLENKINILTVEIKKFEAENELEKTITLSQKLVSLQKQLNLL